jgi:hypothetical protein
MHGTVMDCGCGTVAVTVRFETGATRVVECQDIAHCSHATSTANNRRVVPWDRVDRFFVTVVCRHSQYHPIQYQFQEDETEDDAIEEVSVQLRYSPHRTTPTRLVNEPPVMYTETIAA